MGEWQSYHFDILSTFGDTLYFIVKKHEPTTIAMSIIRNRFKAFATKLKSQTTDNFDILQVGSSYDDLHMSRLINMDNGATEFFPKIDFDMDCVYKDYIVHDVGHKMEKSCSDVENTSEFEQTSDRTPTELPQTATYEISKKSPTVTGMSLEISTETKVESKLVANETSCEKTKYTLPTKDVEKLSLHNVAVETPASSPLSTEGTTKTRINASKMENVQQIPTKGPKTTVKPFALFITTHNPGYVKLLLTEDGRNLFKRMDSCLSKSVTDEGFLKNTSFLSRLKPTHGDEKNIYSRTDAEHFYRSGPAISFDNEFQDSVSYDFVHAYPCNTWPSLADGWGKRAKSCHWPSQEIIQDILTDGALFVPVGSHQSFESELEWRISFVVSERKLSCSLSETQKTCYAVIKLVLKSNLSTQSIITSYMMKNVFYYLCEETELSLWDKSNLGNMMLKFLKYIAVCLHVKRIPHYFLPPINLIGHFNDDLVQSAKKEIEEIVKNPFSSILTACSKMQCFDVIGANGRFTSLGGFAQYILPIYTSFVPILWNLSELNMSDVGQGNGFEFAGDCLQKLLELNIACAVYVQHGSDRYTAKTMVELLKPLAIAYMQNGDIRKALNLFLTIDKADSIIVEQFHPEVFVNIACLYGALLGEILAEKQSTWFIFLFTRKPKISIDLHDKAMLYYEKSLSCINKSQSLHLAFGNFLFENEHIVKAVEQFHMSLDIEEPQPEDKVFVEIHIPGNSGFKQRRANISGKTLSFYRIVESYMKLDDIYMARCMADRFVNALEVCTQPEKALACQLCGFSMLCVGLHVKASVMFSNAVKYDLQCS